MKDKWPCEIFESLQECGFEGKYTEKVNVEVEELKHQVWAKCSQSWAEDIWRKPKLT